MTSARAIAALPMYDLADVRKATDAWWSGIARAGRRHGLADLPKRLRRDLAGTAVFSHPDLLLAQTCGYPFTHALAGRVRLVATPAYRTRGCDGAWYRSLIVVREDDPVAAVADLAGRRVAINARDSQSGHVALRAALIEAGVSVVRAGPVTGSHSNSITAVQRGAADAAAIDCVVHGLLARHRPAALAGTRILDETPSAPGLPYVTAATHGDGVLLRLRDALRSAAEDPRLAAARDDLLLDGFEVLDPSAYRRIRALERRGMAVRCDPIAGDG